MPSKTQLLSKLLSIISIISLEKKKNPIWMKFDNKSDRGEVSLADLLIAAKDLPWENETQLRQIAQSLGFKVKEGTSLSEKRETNYTKSIYDRNYYDSISRPKPKETSPQLPFTAPPPPELPIELSSSAQLLPSELKPRSSNEPDEIKPNWLTGNNNFPSLLPTSQSAEETVIALQRKNLFSDNTYRGILTASLSTQRSGFDPDVPQIISRIVRGEILHNIPLKITTTLDQGCQLLLDYNETMVPYWADLTNLSTQLKNVLGSERVDLYEFKNHPLDARQWLSRKKHKNWELETTKPVLVASNLGQSSNPDDYTDLKLLNIDEEWQEFIQCCEKKRVPLLILTPWQKTSWPAGWGNYPIFIHWNPKTTASMVRQLIGKGLEVNS